MDSAYNATANPTAFPVINNRTARAVSVGPDNQVRLLDASATGEGAVRMVDSSFDSRSSLSLGPYPAYTPTDIAVGPDNNARILWAPKTGSCALWTMDPSFKWTSSDSFAPAGWAAARITTTPDNNTEILWANGQGQYMICTIDPAMNYLRSSPVFGPY